MPTRSPATLVLAAALLLGACSGDDDGASGTAEDTTSTSSLDPGVTFEDDVTVPTDAGGQPSATTAPVDPDDVVSVPREVPEDFPADFPVPDDAAVEIGSVGSAEGEQRFAVDYTIARTDPADTFAFYEDAVDEAGWNVLLRDTDAEGQDFIGQLVFETDTFIGNVLVSGDGTGGVLLTLTATMPD
jgi:hypothetical protein